MHPPTFPVRVALRRQEGEDIVAFELHSTDGRELPAFSAGAHIDVLLPGALTRQYSLYNNPAERHRYCIAVLREPAGRGGSAAMHAGVEAGDLLQISVPKNHFPLATGAAHSLLLAGGIGITPLLSMAAQLHSEGTAFDLHYCTRSLARTAFAEALRKVDFARHVHLHHDDGAPDQRLDIEAVLAAPRPDHHLYVCGPKGLLDHVRDTSSRLGWPSQQVHFEYFAGGEAHGPGQAAFDLVLHRSGRVIRVAPEQTVVDALAACGIAVPVSCQQGVCGTCLTKVIEGEVEHKDLYLTPEEQHAHREFLPCCSRARGPRLVLDL